MRQVLVGGRERGAATEENDEDALPYAHHLEVLVFPLVTEKMMGSSGGHHGLLGRELPGTRPGSRQWGREQADGAHRREGSRPARTCPEQSSTTHPPPHLQYSADRASSKSQTASAYSALARASRPWRASSCCLTSSHATSGSMHPGKGTSTSSQEEHQYRWHGRFAECGRVGEEHDDREAQGSKTKAKWRESSRGGFKGGGREAECWMRKRKRGGGKRTCAWSRVIGSERQADMRCRPSCPRDSAPGSHRSKLLRQARCRSIVCTSANSRTGDGGCGRGRSDRMASGRGKRGWEQHAAAHSSSYQVLTCNLSSGCVCECGKVGMLLLDWAIAGRVAGAGAHSSLRCAARDTPFAFAGKSLPRRWWQVVGSRSASRPGRTSLHPPSIIGIIQARRRARGAISAARPSRKSHAAGASSGPVSRCSTVSRVVAGKVVHLVSARLHSPRARERLLACGRAASAQTCS